MFSPTPPDVSEFAPRACKLTGGTERAGVILGQLQGWTEEA